MTVKIGIRNPSDQPRKGLVSTPWQEIARRAGIEDERDLVVRYVLADGSQIGIRAQVNSVNPQDPSRATLTFVLDREVPGGPEDYSRDSAYVTVGRGKAVQFPVGAYLEIEKEHKGINLANSRLNIWFHLSPDKEGKDWFSGSASSVQLDGQEILDNFRGQFTALGHDPEKRCMQIDRIRLSHPTWEPAPFQEEYLIHHKYELISSSQGPIGASITIASEPFSYNYSDPLGLQQRGLRCRLYRVFSLYQDADYLLEDLYLQGTPRERGTPIDLYFSARYFSYFDVSLTPRIVHFSHIPDWLALGCPWAPYQGYGFATDVHAAPVSNPHSGFPLEEGRHKSFSWELGWGNAARCLHLFKRCPPEVLASETGLAWYDHVYKPLRAVALSEEAV